MTKKQNNLFYFFFLLASLFFLIFNNLDLSIIYIIILFSAYLLSVVPIIYYLKNFNNYPYLPIFPLANIYFISCYLSIFFFNKNLMLNIGENTFLQKAILNMRLKFFFMAVHHSWLVFILLFKFQKINRQGIKFLNYKIRKFLL